MELKVINFVLEFDYTREKILIKELFDNLNIEFEFFVNSYDIVQSNLTLYQLPFSESYQEEFKTWKLPKLDFPLKIKEKNLLMNQIINNEKNSSF